MKKGCWIIKIPQVLKREGFKSVKSAKKWRKWPAHTENVLLVIIKTSSALRKYCVSNSGCWRGGQNDSRAACDQERWKAGEVLCEFIYLCIYLCLNFLDMATCVPVSSPYFVPAGSQEALGGACRCLNDVQHCAVPSCHAGHCCFSVTALCIT